MTLQFFSSKIIRGDENDTKPLNVPDGTIFYELNTGGTVVKSALISGAYVELSEG